jgi:hypothetical protein
VLEARRALLPSLKRGAAHATRRSTTGVERRSNDSGPAGVDREPAGRSHVHTGATASGDAELTLHFELDDSGPREPYRVEMIVEAPDVDPAKRPPYRGWDGIMPDPPSGA